MLPRRAVSSRNTVFANENGKQTEFPETNGCPFNLETFANGASRTRVNHESLTLFLRSPSRLHSEFYNKIASVVILLKIKIFPVEDRFAIYVNVPWRYLQTVANTSILSIVMVVGLYCCSQSYASFNNDFSRDLRRIAICRSLILSLRAISISDKYRN